MLYFAYGSNMSEKRLRARVRSAVFHTIATLKKYRLAFHKIGRDGSAKCDALFTGNSSDAVIGVVFSIEKNEKELLDECEDLGAGYDEKWVTVISDKNEAIRALTYYTIQIDDALLPFDWYKNHLLIGAREHGLPDFYIEKIEAVQSIADADANRKVRELGIYHKT